MTRREVAIFMGRKDPLLAWLLRQRVLTPLRTAVSTLLLVALLDGLIIYVQGTAVATDSAPALYENWNEFLGGLTRDLVLAPSIMGFYMWLPLDLDSMLRKLRSSKAFYMTEDQYSSMITQEVGPVCSDRKWTYAVGLLTASGLVFWFLFWGGYLGPFDPTWLEGRRGIFVFLLRLPVWGICGYAGLMLVVNEIIAIRVLRRLFRDHPIRVRLFHPDKCGGLKPTGEHTLRFAYLIALAGFAILVAGFLSSQLGRIAVGDFPLYTSIVLYLIMSPTLFFTPLLPVRSAMKAAKQLLLVGIASELEKEYRHARDDLSRRRGEPRKALDRIESLKSLYALAERYPEWPLDISLRRRFFVTIPVTVLSSFVASLLAGLTLKWLVT